MRALSLAVDFAVRLGATLGLARARARIAVVQYAILAGVCAYLALQLSKIGWSQIASSFPESPLFYLIFALRYFLLPLFEVATYSIVLRRPMGRHFPAFVRKRVYNVAVMGYSGEAFFTLWARRSLKLTTEEVLLAVKDNNIVSAFVSNAATALLVAGLYFAGRLGVALEAMPEAALLFTYAFVAPAIFALGVALFRDRLLSAAPDVVAKLVVVNVARLLLALTLHALLYWAALPAAPMETWLVFCALHLSLSRVPFAPALDILFLTAALHFSSLVAAPAAAVAGMLAAETGLAQLLNVALFAATAHLAAPLRRPRPSAPDTALPIGADGRRR